MKLTEKTKNALSLFARGAFSLLALFIVYKIVNIKETIKIIKSSDVNMILLAGGVFFIINIILLVRWFVFIHALGLSVSKRNVIRSYFIGLFGNLFLPSAIGGDILKTIGLCKESSQKAKVVASVLLDRLSGFASIIFVSALAFIVGFSYIRDYFLIIPIGIMTIGGGAIGVTLFNEKVYSFCCRIFHGVPKIKNSLMKLHYDIALLKNKRREAIYAVLISCLSQIILSIVFFLLAKALHQDIRLVYFLIFVPIICVASAVPSIGGLGVRELGAVYLFSRIGINEGISASLSLMTFFFMVLSGVLGGFIYVVTLSSRRV